MCTLSHDSRSGSIRRWNGQAMLWVWTLPQTGGSRNWSALCLHLYLISLKPSGVIRRQDNANATNYFPIKSKFNTFFHAEKWKCIQIGPKGQFPHWLNDRVSQSITTIRTFNQFHLKTKSNFFSPHCSYSRHPIHLVINWDEMIQTTDAKRKLLILHRTWSFDSERMNYIPFTMQPKLQAIVVWIQSLLVTRSS